MNGKSYPNTESLDVRAGQRVRLKLFNMNMEDHPMHLHGHTFQVVGIGGQPVDGPLKDTLTVRHMERYEIEFVANSPGNWRFHCYNLVHMGGGLLTEVHYRNGGPAQTAIEIASGPDWGRSPGDCGPDDAVVACAG